jgi:hypothetical protein
MTIVGNSLLRDEALRKIGRNLVNFQRFEKALKLIIVKSDIRGYASQIAKQYADKFKDTDRKPLGWVVEEFLQSVYASSSATENTNEESREIWMSLAFRVESDGDQLRKLKSDLRGLVKDRNRLIHDSLARFEPDSDESCRALISLLDEQHDRLEPHYHSAMRMLGEVQALQRNVLEQLESQLRKDSGNEKDAVYHNVMRKLRQYLSIDIP